jgi:hypothetical protein
VRTTLAGQTEKVRILSDQDTLFLGREGELIEIPELIRPDSRVVVTSMPRRRRPSAIAPATHSSR